VFTGFLNTDGDIIIMKGGRQVTQHNKAKARGYESVDTIVRLRPKLHARVKIFGQGVGKGEDAVRGPGTQTTPHDLRLWLQIMRERRDIAQMEYRVKRFHEHKVATMEEQRFHIASRQYFIVRSAVDLIRLAEVALHCDFIDGILDDIPRAKRRHEEEYHAYIKLMEEYTDKEEHTPRPRWRKPTQATATNNQQRTA